MINTLIFDFDMTLVDSLHACAKGANIIAKRFGLPEVSTDVVVKAMSLTTEDFWKTVWGEAKPEWMDYFVKEIVPSLNHEINVFPGVEEFLTTAKERGYLLALGSNRANPWFDLAEIDLAKYFDTAVGVTDAPSPKPHPDILLTAVKHLGNGCDEAVYIGDAVSDILAAKAAGLKALGVAQGGASVEDLTRAGAWMTRPTVASCRDLFNF
jgi:HAD superfamily hydrolase (TIGR01509 family)